MLEVGSRVMILNDFLGPDEWNEFEWLPMAGDEGVVVNTFVTELGEQAYDVRIDNDEIDNESWPYLASEIEEIAA